MTDEIHAPPGGVDGIAVGIRPVTLALGARLLVAVALMGGLAGLGVLIVQVPLAVVALVYVALAAREAGSAAASPRWPAGVVDLADLMVGAVAASLVAVATTPALIPVGAAAALPLVGAATMRGGRAGGLRMGAFVLFPAALGAVAVGRPVGLAAIVALAPVAAWIIGVTERVGGLAAAGLRHDEELARTRKEMVTTVSHELRTPLTIIQGAMATLSRRWDVLSEPERLDLVDVLIDNVASLDSSILHFVDAGKLERGGFLVKPEWVDVAQAVTRVRGKLTTVLSGHNIQMDLTVSEMWADPAALGRIIEHLLVNAARFSPIGLPITLRTNVQGSDFILSVVDRGQGIPPHLINAVWTPLERGDVTETGVSRGAGLGLPIVRELARLHGGDADLRSVKGRGTTVTVRFPVPAGSARLDQLTELPRTARRRGRRAGAAPPAAG